MNVEPTSSKDDLVDLMLPQDLAECAEGEGEEEEKAAGREEAGGAEEGEEEGEEGAPAGLRPSAQYNTRQHVHMNFPLLFDGFHPRGGDWRQLARSRSEIPEVPGHCRGTVPWAL